MTFRMKVPEDEVSLYWNRLRLTGGKLSREEFYMKLSPYMTEESRLQVTKNRLRDLDPRTGLSQINRLLDKNTEQLVGVSQKPDALHILCKQLANFVKSNDTTVKEVLQKFDRDGTGTIRHNEFRSALSGFGVVLDRDQIEEVLGYLDYKNEGQILTREFNQIMEQEILYEFKRITSEESNLTHDNKKEIFSNVVKFLFDYMRKHNIGLVDLFDRIDVKKKTSVSKDDLQAFFRGIGASLQPRELTVFDDEIDPKGTNKINSIQFCSTLKPYISEKPQVTS
jgi:Ca2+-binding EF-hand superfamily protein